MASQDPEHEGMGHHHHHPPIGVHGMLLVGEAPIYLSHLPMFMAPHNFQVILEVTLDAEANRRFEGVRAQSRPDELYTVKPEAFSIVDLLPVDPANEALSEFKADIFRGHFEKGGDLIANSATVAVTGVIHFQELGPADKAANLEYILFGSEQQSFLAHRITQPPDFDQVLSVKISDHVFTEDELRREHFGVLITIPERPNTPHDRIKLDEKVSGRGHVTGAHQIFEVNVEVVSEIYFEEGELLKEADFSPTEEEEPTGFGEH
jgi:hypothetical protein